MCGRQSRLLNDAGWKPGDQAVERLWANARHSHQRIAAYSARI